MFYDFFTMLREYQIPISMSYILDFYQGIEKGLVNSLYDLFVFSKLIFVKKVEYADSFERCFAFYFYGVDIPKVAEGDFDLFHTKQFQDWLTKAYNNGELESHPGLIDREELMKKFWNTVREQLEAHHGGNKWVGTGGTSPFGHSGTARPGIRVYGDTKNKSALKVIGDRRYIDYSEKNILCGENLTQALERLKNLKHSGGYTELNIDETIYEAGKSGGEIELVFEKEMRDKLEVILLLDNGGTSMYPYVERTRELFNRMKNQMKKIKTYFFHNTIYSYVYKDSARHQAYSVYSLLESSPDSRVFIVGDASMAPDELLYNYGSIHYGEEEYEPSTAWLNRIQQRFKHTIWLNPIDKETWKNAYGAYTINKIRNIFHMEDMTMGGISRAVEHMNRQNG